jgi:hypothetical protein
MASASTHGSKAVAGNGRGCTDGGEPESVVVVLKPGTAARAAERDRRRARGEDTSLMEEEGRAWSVRL